MASRLEDKPRDHRSIPADVMIHIDLAPAPVSPNEVRIVLNALGAELARLFEDEW